MSNLVTTQIETSKAIREKLFGTLDKLIEGEIDLDHVEGIVAVSEQVLSFAKLDFDVAVKAEEYNQRNKDRELIVLNRVENMKTDLLSIEWENG